MFEKALILGLYSVTPVHAGSGAELSVIDLPIQRERHTGFPVIWGQSLKGVLRSNFRRLELKGVIKVDNKNWNWKEEANELYSDKAEDYIKKVEEGKRDPTLTELIFGPSTEGASERAGAISVGDAKILLFPVRSLKGVFAYVTCPLVLERFIEDLEFISKIDNKNNSKIIQNARKFIENNKTLSETNAIVFGKDLVVEKNGKKYVVLEDLLLEANVKDENKSEEEIIGLLKEILPENAKDKIDKKLVIVSDEVFTAFATMTTEIVARVKIDANTGTVQRGALWYEEYLPSDTLLYSVVTIGKPRIWGRNDEERKEREKKIKEVFGCDTLDDCVEEIAKNLESLAGYLQIGGNETVGKGFVKVKVWGGKDECSEKSGTKEI